MINDSLSEQLNALRNEYDFIIYDTPPIGIVSDALLLSDLTDASVFVIRHNYVTTDILKKANDTFLQTNRPILGAVLNEIRNGRLQEAYKAGKYREYGYYSYEASVRKGKYASKSNANKSNK